MNIDLEMLEAEVLKLAPADRLRLLERLVASLDAGPVADAEWEHEADRREAQLKSGSLTETAGPEAINRLRSRLVR